MTIYVYHNDSPKSRFVDSPALVREAIAEGYLHMVAKVETNDFNEAYELTNNIHDSWVKNEKVEPCKDAADGCRSTSVGDVFVLDLEDDSPEQVHLVAGFGFHEMAIKADRMIQSDFKWISRAA